ncbi:glycosyl transferase [Candidatus Gottesmanbacteria bacterium CG11_big_fil_rev_8_21_14_0_20_37_11]|uniref:Glycosyltransferase family 2 protein n=2 Tax=Candidatus Gottesmaniibacteriota TaxID=1752720 RepID=A0A2M7RQX7_9BACT|nr:MAG: glycosyl transferase [Candidatus Gottesmanbacteria bacterium CG23_combo_of_CG06-09_8_20_14_all_37_19]PIR08202.1 MAG: glycosyl transferase [Candidatus Gottesmanbacteria bacterium CG11_big_fil_rev_8_21_14_0_20_37_11]PIZ02449.1 MAG: glycosyltransferase family 2 protein [Candidatus Gottesmanbacteria bacterium CG_4_10_14_0_8_um_filter_37_24]
MVKTAVIIIHFKNISDTFDCLDSLSKCNYDKEQLMKIVVLNSSVDSVIKEKLQKKYSGVIVLNNNNNLGFSGGNNVGIQKALQNGCKYLILLNNDTIVDSHLLKDMILMAESANKIGLISPKIYFAHGFEYHKNRYKDDERGKIIWYAGGQIDWNNIYVRHRGVDEFDFGQYDKAVQTDFATGCCMLISRDLIEHIGLLDEKYFLYYEDVDYSIRAIKAGFKIYYLPKAHIWHKNASSSGKPGSKLHIYYQERNRLYFGFKYASIKTKKSLIFDSLRILFKGNVYRDAIVDYYSGRMGYKNI